MHLDSGGALAGLGALLSSPSSVQDILHRIVWGTPQAALGDGWRIVAGDGSESIPSPEVQDAMLELAGLARMGSTRGKEGGAYLWIVPAGDQDPSEPLADGADIAAFHALDFDFCQPIEWDYHPESPNFGRPLVYSVAVNSGAMTIAFPRVHHSRLLYMGSGIRQSKQEMSAAGSRSWSVSSVYGPAIDDLCKGFSSSAILLDRRSVPHLHLKDGYKSLQGNGALGKVQAYLSSFLRNLYQKNLAVTMGDDSFDFRAPTVSGTSELVATLAWRVCAIEGMSLTELFGTPPGGLSTDDEASRRQRESRLSITRTGLYDPVIHRLMDVLEGPDEGRRIEWPPLGEPTAKERADRSLVLAQRDATLVQAGIIDPEEARARHVGKGEVMELEPVGVAPGGLE